MKWKDKVYDIPREEIVNLDMQRTGEHASYRLTSITLKDGTDIKGVIAEEKEKNITVKSRLGYLTVDRTQISEIKKPDKSEILLPSDFLEVSYRTRETKIGIYGLGGANAGEIANGNPSFGGGGFFLEPVSLNFRSKLQLGFAGEFLNLIGKDRIEMSNGFIYLQYRLKFSERLDFYTGLGLGGAYIKYYAKDFLAEGLNPAGFFNLGWQGLKFGNFQTRIGLRATGVVDNYNYANIGVEFALLYRI